MKRLFLIAAVSLAATSAFASKARLSALQNAAHLVDTQDVLNKPDRAASMGEFVTFEFGPTVDATTNAEGGFVRKHGDAAWGAYFGNTSDSTTFYRSAAKAAPYSLAIGTAAQDNPLNLFYATKTSDMSWGAGLFYTNSDLKAVNEKQNAMGLIGSMTMGALNASLGLGLGNTASKTAAGVETKLTGKTTAQLTVGYAMDSLYYYGEYTMSGAKVETGSTTNADWERSGLTLGVINSHKKDAVDFFYGISYQMTNLKDKGPADSKTDTSKLPVIVGIEADAANWLTFRASLTQNVIVGSTKTTTAGVGDANNNADDTVVAAGVGMKWNKFAWDGTLSSASANGGTFGLDGSNFLARTSLTYMF